LCLIIGGNNAGLYNPTCHAEVGIVIPESLYRLQS
jgi:hypothetical protein